MKKGMNVWSLPGDLTLRQQFEITKEAGFDTIELNLTETAPSETIVSGDLQLSEKMDLTMDSELADLEKIKALSEEFALPISSLSTALHWTYPLNSNDAETRERGKYIVRKMIDVCSVLGGDSVLVVPGLVTKDQSYDECYALAKEAFLELAPYAEEKQIKIGVENVWNKFLLSPLEYRQFLDEINSDYVGAYFDVGNILQFGFPEQWIKILDDKIVKIHVKDFKRAIGNIQGFANLLQGDVDWPAVVAALKQIGYTGPLTCELSPYPLNGRQLAADTSAALEYIINL